jgi:hypothetical protein
MIFRLYSDDTCTAQVGSDIDMSGVQVTDGLFSVALDVNQDHFSGRGLWLEVEVAGTAIGCREVLPVPYALSLRPGALVSGTVAGGPVIHAYNTATTGPSLGLRGSSASSGGVGVYGRAPVTGTVGIASATSGKTTGVYGQTYSNANNAAGVRGIASATNGTTIGVHGRNDSSAGAGVYGYASANSGYTAGVFGANISTAGQGVLGLALATSGSAAGVSGQSASATGVGVYGTAPTTGSVGIASAASGETVGVYGRTNSSDDNAAGVYGHASSNSGLTTGVYGVTDSTEGGMGVFGSARADSGTATGVAGFSGSLDGVGVFGWATSISGSRRGVIGTVGWASSGYGLYTDNDLYVGGSCTGCTMVFVARNASQETLQVGDVVAVGGVGPLLQGHTAPVLEVHRATAADVAVLGVVRSRGEFFAARGDQPLDDSDIVQSAIGDAAPGDYVLVVTSGLAQVRVAPDVSNLAPGHVLAVDGPSGRVALAQGSTDPALAFGRAMEAQPDGDGLIWALVGAQ